MRRDAMLLCCALPLAAAATIDLSSALHEVETGATDAGISALHDLADANDPYAELALYVIYDQGLGTAASPHNALLWLRRAAEHDVAAAQAELGDRYYFGRGLPVDPALAREWWRRAARQGEAAAQFNLAAVLRGGDAAQTAEANAWWRAAMAAGYTPALASPATPRTQPLPAPPSTAPFDRTWVLAQPADSYTIHVATGSDAGALAAMLTAHLRGRVIAVADAATPQFIALYGSFPDRDSANAALAELPAALRFNAPRVRRFGVIQSLLDETP